MNSLAMSKTFKGHCLLPLGDIYVFFCEIFCKTPAYKNVPISNLKSIPVNIYDKQVFAARTLYRGRNKQKHFFPFMGYTIGKTKDSFFLVLKSVQLLRNLFNF